MARPAFFWPRGSARMPVRTCSATRAEVKKPRAITAVENSGSGMDCFIQMPRLCGTSSGSTKYHRNICTISGILRNTST